MLEKLKKQRIGKKYPFHQLIRRSLVEKCQICTCSFCTHMAVRETIFSSNRQNEIELAMFGD
jgi:hypothetical protein